MRARGRGEAHRVRFTPALLLCSLLDVYLWKVQGTFSWMFYVPMSAQRDCFYLFCPEEERPITENALVV